MIEMPARVARSEVQSNPNHVLQKSRLMQVRKRGHKTMEFIEVKKRLGNFCRWWSIINIVSLKSLHKKWYEECNAAEVMKYEGFH